MFKPNPTQPMMRISLTSLTSLSEMKRSTDWRKMLMPRASRKAPLKKAPSSLARCQPNEKSWRNSVFSEICFESQSSFHTFMGIIKAHGDGQ